MHLQQAMFQKRKRSFPTSGAAERCDFLAAHKSSPVTGNILSTAIELSLMHTAWWPTQNVKAFLRHSVANRATVRTNTWWDFFETPRIDAARGRHPLQGGYPVHSRTPISLKFSIRLPSVTATGRWRERGGRS